MRVLFVIDSLGLGGGAEHSLAELLPEFRARGLECQIVCIRNREGGLQQALIEDGFRLSVLQPVPFQSKARELRATVESAGPDLVHATLSESCLLSRAAVAGRSVRLVNSLVNNAFDYLHHGVPLARRVRRRVFSLIDASTGLLIVDHYHAVSQDVKNAYVRHLRIPESRITVVYRGRSRKRLGWPTADRRKAVRRRLGIDEGSFVVVNVGRQDVQKGQACLIRAFGELVQRHPDSALVIAGREGDASADIRAAVNDLRAPRHVHILGHREDIPDLLSAADVFALTSFHEGVPGVVIEAMAMSLAIVSSDLGGVREVVQEGVNALFFPPGDSSSLCNSLSDLKERPEIRVSMGRENSRLFEQEFELERATDRMLALYCSVLKGPRS